MAHATTPQAIQDAIAEGPAGETPRQTVARIQEQFGAEISETTAKKYRRKAREERAQATKELREEHAREHTGGALSDLTEIRQTAKARFKLFGQIGMGKLWLDAVRTELGMVSEADQPGEFAGKSDAELEAFARDGSFPAPGAEPAAAGAGPAGA